MIASSTAAWANGTENGFAGMAGVIVSPPALSSRRDPLFSAAFAPFAGKGRVRVAGKVEESIVDGPGLRYVLFTQGCPHHCPGCHNPGTHDASGGVEVSLDEILRDIRKNPITRGVTFSGGEPFLHSETLAPLAAELKRQGYHLMAYTGYLMEELLARPRHAAFLASLDVVVDGPFVLAQRSLDLPFRGSSNQRFIDVPASLAAARAVQRDL